MANNSTLQITPDEEAHGISTAANASAGGSTEKKMLRILSIDGGGVRGIIPATILQYLEEKLQGEDHKERRLADYFDLIVGTSTGGLIAAMITIPGSSTIGKSRTDPTSTKTPLPSAANVVRSYEQYAEKIFPPVKGRLCELWKWLREVWRPRYNAKNLDQHLDTYFGKHTLLSEARKKVIIPSFDIKNQRPVFFSSWEEPLNGALVRDVCRATTAAPTYLPPVYFTVPPTEDKKKKDHTKNDPQQLKFNMIDGGIAVNNPVGFSSGLFSSTFVNTSQFSKHI
jgi:patatin-like phospholipase/acyl hydrolase